jgi:predicted polyphosphate/ATP-dependent NAD kinase
MKRIGLIVNPVAGLGGRVGLKGSDGREIQQLALKLGAIPRATERSVKALICLQHIKTDLEILTYPGMMGEIAVTQAGLVPQILGEIQSDLTTAEDTKRAVKEMLDKDLALLMFTGGDGTARDIFAAGGLEIPTLGIPAGVKIHSAVYAIHPFAAGELAMAFLCDQTGLNLAEVMDVDEEAYRKGCLSPKLYGYLKVPYLQRYVQGAKVSNPASSSIALSNIAEDLSARLKPGTIYIFGPGSSTQAISKHLGMDKNLLGVDAFLDGKIIAADANETTLLNLLGGAHLAEIIVTPIGGQGCILGRGNQQISPEVIRNVGKSNLHIVSTPEKLLGLKGKSLWVDTGDQNVDEMLCGYYPVITGYKEYVMYKVTT